MLAAYGVDVLDPAVTPRRIAVLLERLPPWARRPGQDWSTESELLATLVDHVANLTYVTLKAAGAKHVGRPRPVLRPSDRGAKREPSAQDARNPRAIGPGGGKVKTSSWAEAIELLAGMQGVKVTGGSGG